MKLIFALLMIAAANAVKPTATSGQWKLDHEQDPMTDQSSYDLHLTQEDGSSVDVECASPGKKSISVIIMPANGVFLGQGVRELDYRFNDAPPLRTYTQYADEGLKITSRSLTLSFIAQLRDAARFRARLIDYRNMTHDLDFSVPPADAEIEQVLQLCGDEAR